MSLPSTRCKGTCSWSLPVGRASLQGYCLHSNHTDSGPFPPETPMAFNRVVSPDLVLGMDGDEEGPHGAGLHCSGPVKASAPPGIARRPLLLCPGRGEEVFCHGAQRSSLKQGSSNSALFCWKEGRCTVHCQILAASLTAIAGCQ